MKAVKIHARTNDSGVAEVKVPTDLCNADIDLIIVVDNEEDAVGRREKTGRYVFSDLVGAIKWDVDPVAYQRKLREEW